MATPVSAMCCERTVLSTRDLVLQIASVLVERPDETVLDVVILCNEVQMTLTASPADEMNMVGPRGIIIKAIRAVLDTINSKTKYQFALMVKVRGLR